MRHSAQTIDHLKQLRVVGFTLSEIILKTGLSKTTIFHHIKKIPKSETLKLRLKEISRISQRNNADSRRGKSVKSYTFRRPKKWTPDFVDLVAHFMFDGDIRHSSCCYNNRNKVLIESVKNLMNKLLKINDYKLYIDKRTGVYKLCYFNVEVAAFINEKAKNLLDKIITTSRPMKISFLKSFFDDEGCVTFEKKRRFVRGYQHTLRILEIIKQLLSEFNIDSKISPKYFEIIISRKENLMKFQKLINFTPGVTVNGNRSNSIWKKSLEKREILKMAIDSYLN